MATNEKYRVVGAPYKGNVAWDTGKDCLEGVMFGQTAKGEQLLTMRQY